LSFDRRFIAEFGLVKAALAVRLLHGHDEFGECWRTGRCICNQNQEAGGLL
jgi:hypothetical protein